MRYKRYVLNKLKTVGVVLQPLNPLILRSLQCLVKASLQVTLEADRLLCKVNLRGLGDTRNPGTAIPALEDYHTVS